MIQHNLGDKIDYRFRLHGNWFDVRLDMRNTAFAFDVYSRHRYSKEWEKIGAIAGMESLRQPHLKQIARGLVEAYYVMSSL